MVKKEQQKKSKQPARARASAKKSVSSGRVVFHKESASAFYAQLGKRAGMDVAEMEEFSGELLAAIEENLSHEERVLIPGFGVFHLTDVESREGHNPRTGETLTIAAHRRVSFKAAAALASSVNRKYRHLKPNVLDEIKSIAGLGSAAISHSAEERRPARKRAIITLVILFLLLLFFLGGVITVPVYFQESNNRAVVFARELNQMLGMEDVSKSLADVAPHLDRVRIREYMHSTAAILSKDRTIIAHHKVKKGESIYSIANRYWGNQFLWPDLYYTNRSDFSDPDLIHRGDEIVVYEKLGDPDSFSREKRIRLVEAYITMYRVTRALGQEEIKKGRRKKGLERIRNSQWTLYTALRYNHDLLEDYREAILPEDSDTVLGYIERFGYGDEKKEEE